MKNFYNRNNFKLSFDKFNKHFYVNEKKRTVTCVVEAVLNVPSSWDSVVNLWNKPFKVACTSKCHPDDRFDVDRGKRIALAKAENKTYEMSLKYLHEYEEHLLFILNAIENFRDKSNRQCEHNLDFIETLTNENHPMYKKELPVLISGETTFVN